MTTGVSNKTLLERKICTQCRAEKPATEFYRKGDRLESSCKECKRAKKREDYRLNLNVKGKQRLCDVLGLVTGYRIAQIEATLSDVESLIETSGTS